MATIQLTSKTSFTVYKELTFIDKSIDLEKAKVVVSENLMKIQPDFINTGILIKKGTHSYDEKVMTYPTVRNFIKKGVITMNINAEEALAKYEVNGEETETEEVAEKKVTKPKAKTVKEEKPISIDDIAGE